MAGIREGMKRLFSKRQLEKERGLKPAFERGKGATTPRAAAMLKAQEKKEAKAAADKAEMEARNKRVREKARLAKQKKQE